MNITIEDDIMAFLDAENPRVFRLRCSAIFFFLSLLAPLTWTVQAFYYKDPLYVPFPVDRHELTTGFTVLYEHAYALGMEANESEPPGPVGCILGLQEHSTDPGRCIRVAGKVSFRYSLKGPHGFHETGSWADHTQFGYEDMEGRAEGNFKTYSWLPRGSYVLELTEMQVPKQLAIGKPYLVVQKNGVDFTPQIPYWILSGLTSLILLGLTICFLIAGVMTESVPSRK